jgi:hypothetical protein
MPEHGLRLAELRAEDPLAVPAAAVESTSQTPSRPGDTIGRMLSHAGVQGRRVGSQWQRYRRLRAMEPEAGVLRSYWRAIRRL